MASLGDIRSAAPAGLSPGGAFVCAEAPPGSDPLETLASRLAGRDLAQVLLFAAPSVDLPALAAALRRRVGAAVTGCTTAGEIGADGYVDGSALAIGLPKSRFAAHTVLIEDLGRIDAAALGRRILSARTALAVERPQLRHAFAFLVCDGLSRREDSLMAALAPSLGGMPLFGGSAGDGGAFRRTVIAHDGQAHQGGAAVVLLRSAYVARLFSFDNLTPTETCMVVTAADPESRIVHEINGEPAAREYARLLGLDAGQLDEYVIAAHPLAVRIGGRHHVRAVQSVGKAGELRFFSAVDEGMVLRATEPRDIARDLDRSLCELAEAETPLGIIACDCVLRRRSAERDQAAARVSAVLARHGVRGFSTYGEQFGTIHLNQTLTGVAFYAGDAPLRPGRWTF
jgi:hypothetical protein